MRVTDERPAALGGEVLRKDGIGCRLDLGRARVEFAIGRLLKRSGHDAPFGSNVFRAQKPPGLKSSIAAAAPDPETRSHFFLGRRRLRSLPLVADCMRDQPAAASQTILWLCVFKKSLIIKYLHGILHDFSMKNIAN